jgi:hypothetical protein
MLSQLSYISIYVRVGLAPTLRHLDAYSTGYRVSDFRVLRYTIEQCTRQDLNLYALSHWLLEPACLPFHHGCVVVYPVISRQGFNPPGLGLVIIFAVRQTSN